MANKIKQFRFYSDSENVLGKNQPTSAKLTDFVNGSVFDNYYPILQLGVQSLPGTKFYLNEGAEPIIIGSTGIYELDLIGQTEITKMQFDYASMNLIANNNQAHLIVDILYEAGNEGGSS